MWGWDGIYFLGGTCDGNVTIILIKKFLLTIWVPCRDTQFHSFNLTLYAVFKSSPNIMSLSRAFFYAQISINAHTSQYYYAWTTFKFPSLQYWGLQRISLRPCEPYSVINDFSLSFFPSIQCSRCIF